MGENEEETWTLLDQLSLGTTDMDFASVLSWFEDSIPK